MCYAIVNVKYKNAPAKLEDGSNAELKSCIEEVDIPCETEQFLHAKLEEIPTVKARLNTQFTCVRNR